MASKDWAACPRMQRQMRFSLSCQSSQALIYTLHIPTTFPFLFSCKWKVLWMNAILLTTSSARSRSWTSRLLGISSGWNNHTVYAQLVVLCFRSSYSAWSLYSHLQFKLYLITSAFSYGRQGRYSHASVVWTVRHCISRRVPTWLDRRSQIKVHVSMPHKTPTCTQRWDTTTKRLCWNKPWHDICFKLNSIHFVKIHDFSQWLIVHVQSRMGKWLMFNVKNSWAQTFRRVTGCDCDAKP